MTKRRNLRKTGKASSGIVIPANLDPEQPRLVAILFFDYSNQTEAGKLNLNGIFDRLFVDTKEKRTVPFGIFVRTAKTLDAPVQVAILTPKRKPTGGIAFSVNSADLGDQKPDMVQFLGNVQFDAPVEGNYWFDVSFRGERLGGCPLKIEFKDFKELIDGHRRGDA